MTKEKLMDMIYDWDWTHSYSNHEELADNIRAALDEERKGEGWIKQDEVLEILARHEFPDNIDGVCDQNIELRLIAEEIESLPRHPAAPSPEPLAVLAEQKGCWVSRSRHLKDRWVINLDTLDYNIPDSPPFISDTYAEAEAKARAYLEGLPDVDKEGR